MTVEIGIPLSTVVDGRTWSLFSVDYSTADGEFQFFIHAIGFEHAAAIVAELKDTARLSGQIVEVRR